MENKDEVMNEDDLIDIIDSIKNEKNFNEKYLIFMDEKIFPYLEIKEMCAHFYNLGMHRAIEQLEKDRANEITPA